MAESPDLTGLVAAVRSGDNAAFERMTDLIKTRCWGFIHARSNTPEDAEEIYITVLTNVWQSLDQLTDPENLLVWVFRIVRNRISDYYRGVKPKLEEINEVNLPPDPKSRPETRVIEGERSAHLQQCIGSLPEEMGDLIRLHYLGGLTLKEISEVTGRSLNTLKTHHRRAKLKLADCLTRHGFKPKGE